MTGTGVILGMRIMMGIKHRHEYGKIEHRKNLRNTVEKYEMHC
jgi:hypothetical protein